MKFIDEKLENYAIDKSTKPSSVADNLEEFTRKEVPMSQMLVGKMEASLLGFLLRSINAKRVLEFGTYTGYSALAMAENLPEGGVVHTLDINPETVEQGRAIWKDSSHAKKIKTHFGPALDVITEIEGEFDFVFIDADKVNYSNYLKMALERLSLNGIIVVDNVLWSGKVLNEKSDESTQAIKDLNNLVKESESLYGTLLPVRDGMFLIQKM